MNDIITGIKVIKMYAWENAFKKVIADARRLVFNPCTLRYVFMCRCLQILVSSAYMLACDEYSSKMLEDEVQSVLVTFIRMHVNVFQSTPPTYMQHVLS